MFGYPPAPCRCQIGNRIDLYRSTFCGLCNPLAGQYGQPARFLDCGNCDCGNCDCSGCDC